MRCLFLACALLSAVAHADDWGVAVGKNPSRYSLSDEFGPSSPQILWNTARPAIVAQQGCAVGNLLITNRIGDFSLPNGTLIVAQDLTTGAELWAVNVPSSFGDSWRSRVTGIRDGQVYATRSGNTNKEYLYALDPATGGILWTSQALIDESTTESISFAENGDIIAGNFGSILRIDKNNGQTVWSVSRVSPTSDGSSVAVYGNKAYYWEAGAHGPKVTALDLTTKASYTSSSIGGGFVQQVPLFVGPDGTVYAPRTQNNVTTDFFVAFQDTGTALVEKWRIPLGYVPFANFGVGPDGSVYAYATTKIDSSTTELYVLRLNPATGAELSRTEKLICNLPAQPRMAIDAAGRVFLTNGGFSLGRLYSFNADLSTRWSVPITNVNLGGPVIGQGGVLVVCGVGQDVRAYKTNDTPVLSGTVALDLYSASPAGLGATIEFRQPGTTTVLHSYPITLNGSGGYSTGVDAGTYDIALKFPHFLRAVLGNRTVTAGPNVADFGQINGDVDGNNAVELPDLNAVLVNFDTDLVADLDGTGHVDLSDLTISLLNFGLVGTP